MVFAKDLVAHVENCKLIKLTCPECHLTYTREDESLHTETKCVREQLLQRNSELQAEFEAHRKQQAEVTNTLLDRLDRLATKVQELEGINRHLTWRLHETSLKIYNCEFSGATADRDETETMSSKSNVGILPHSSCTTVPRRMEHGGRHCGGWS